MIKIKIYKSINKRINELSSKFGITILWEKVYILKEYEPYFYHQSVEVEMNE